MYILHLNPYSNMRRRARERDTNNSSCVAFIIIFLHYDLVVQSDLYNKNPTREKRKQQEKEVLNIPRGAPIASSPTTHHSLVIGDKFCTVLVL